MKEITPARRTENVRYAIRDLVVVADELKRQGKEIIHLNIGDPLKFDYETPSAMIEAVYRAMLAGNNGYGPSSGVPQAVEVIKAEAEAHGIRNIEEIFITAGVTEAIEITLTALVNGGENILIPYPCYPVYSAILGKLSAEVTPYYLDEDNGWLPDPGDIEKRINEKTRAILLINPNNPTGAIYSEEILKEIIEIAKKHNLLIISDEIYDKFLLADKKHIAIASLDNEVPVMTFNGLSKAHLVPGWRVGWGILSGAVKLISHYKEAVNKLLRARLCHNYPIQFAIKPALTGNQNYLKEMVEKLRKRCDLTYERLNAIPHISLVKPEAAFYAFARIDLPISDEKFVRQLLSETGVLVVHGAGFGESPGTAHFRVVYLAPEDVLSSAYDKLEEFVKKHY
jgi:alanine-synthesizing transaminase